MADEESAEAYPQLDHLLACEAWDGKADCVYRGEEPDDWCDACTARVDEVPRLRAEIRRAALEECLQLVHKLECLTMNEQSLRAECVRQLRSLLGGEK